MDEANCALAAGLVSPAYVNQGSQALARRRKRIKSLLSQRRLPAEGWDDASIELLLQEAALMDSNNFLDNVGVGEREARVASELVARRHYRLAHGIGRSGDIAAEQPKAAGSSFLARLTHLLAADALEAAGMAEVGSALVVPLATGMALTATLLALRGTRPPTARYVLWPRIDQKTCLKAIIAAGLEAVPLPLLLEGDQLVTDVEGLRRRLEELGPDCVAAVVTTTSCFAPRAADDVVAVAKLCQAAGVGHVINNAYGVQSRALCALVASAWRKGRVDAVVQSTDKNFMVPVGGAIIAARRGQTQLVERVGGMYPGRASMSPLLDLLITLLHWGADGWRRVLQDREALFLSAQARLCAATAGWGERLLCTPGNPISMAITLDTLQQPPTAQRPQQQAQAEPGGQAPGAARVGRESGDGSPPAVARRDLPATFLGSMLFSRCVSGTRVVGRGQRVEVGGHVFDGYGSHCDAYPRDYLTVAAALGGSGGEVEEFVGRMGRCLAEFRSQQQGGKLACNT